MNQNSSTWSDHSSIYSTEIRLITWETSSSTFLSAAKISSKLNFTNSNTPCKIPKLFLYKILPAKFNLSTRVLFTATVATHLPITVISPREFPLDPCPLATKTAVILSVSRSRFRSNDRPEGTLKETRVDPGSGNKSVLAILRLLADAEDFVKNWQYSETFFNGKLARTESHRADSTSTE